MIQAMDRNDKIKMLLDMQEHPEQFSEETLNAMLEDSEVRELMEATAQLKRAMIWHSPLPNSSTPQLLNSSIPIMTKIAASFIGILLVSGIAFAAIHFVSNVNDTKSQTVQTEQQVNTPSPQLPNSSTPQLPSSPTPIVFDNVTLDSIAKDIAAYHHIGIDLQNEQACQLRFYFVWKQEDSLQEVVEKLNMFEHVNMTVENGKLMVR